MQLATIDVGVDVGGESWFAAAFDAAPIGMLVVDATGRIVFANVEASRAFDSRELEGLRLEALLASEDRKPILDALTLALAGDSTTRTVWGVDHAGRRFPLEVSLRKLDSKRLMAIVVLRSIDEASLAVQDARSRLEAMLECAPAFIIGVSANATIDFINRTLPQYSKESVIGMHWLAFFSPDQHAFMTAKLKAMYDTESTQVFEVNTPGPDGRLLWFESQIAPIRRDGLIVGAILVSQDISERKRAQAELLANRHMALLGTLAAGIAHEINTPIQFVGDNIHFLSEASADLLHLLETNEDLRRAAIAGEPLAPLVEAAQAAEAEIDLPYLRDSLPSAFESSIDGLNKISKIVRSLKDFAHPPQEAMVAVDLNRVVESALTIATNEYKFVATVETHLGEVPPIACHAAEISQVVLNLVVNAAHAIGDVVKGSDRKGLITVSTRYEDNMAVISITDTGTGIPETIRARIFDPFFTTKEVGKGTGQGLSIAWSMVKERHGGELTFETEVGVGTTFVIRIPNAKAS